MTNSVRTSDIERLLEDATYLQDEATALQYLISDIPFAERPPKGESIYEILLRIDRMQTECYRPFLKSVLEHKPGIQLPELSEESVESPEPGAQEMQDLLKSIAKHRASLLNTASKLSKAEWETALQKGGRKTLSVFEALNEMVTMERGLLREIALLIRDAQQHRESQRQNRPGSSDRT